MQVSRFEQNEPVKDCNCREDLRARKIARGIWWVGFASLVFALAFQPVLLWIYA